jgi:hypothetical protein
MARAQVIRSVRKRHMPVVALLAEELWQLWVMVVDDDACED